MNLIAANLIDTTGSEPRLLGGRAHDGRIVFPLPAGSAEFEPVPLAREGRLWAYTVQRFCPKTPYLGAADPASFKPYAVGYVELPEIIVEARLDTEDFAALRIGQRMRLTLVPFAPDADGAPVFVYAFTPIGDHSSPAGTAMSGS